MYMYMYVHVHRDSFDLYICNSSLFVFQFAALLIHEVVIFYTTLHSMMQNILLPWCVRLCARVAKMSGEHVTRNDGSSTLWESFSELKYL